MVGLRTLDVVLRDVGEVLDCLSILVRLWGVCGCLDRARPVWVLTRVDLEWCEMGAGLLRVVIGEFRERQLEIPIGLFQVCVGAQDLFEGAVGPFCLSVCLWMVGGGCGQFDAEEIVEGAPEMSGEAGIAIRDDDFGEAMVFEDMIEEELCCKACLSLLVFLFFSFALPLFPCSCFRFTATPCLAKLTSPHLVTHRLPHLVIHPQPCTVAYINPALLSCSRHTS